MTNISIFLPTNCSHYSYPIQNILSILQIWFSQYQMLSVLLFYYRSNFLRPVAPEVNFFWLSAIFNICFEYSSIFLLNILVTQVKVWKSPICWRVLRTSSTWRRAAASSGGATLLITLRFVCKIAIEIFWPFFSNHKSCIRFWPKS